MRLLELVAHAPTGKLTCHVLDTASGGPAAGMGITLRRLGGDGDAGSGGAMVLGDFVTNADGRLDGGPALAGAALAAGRYEWTFHVGEVSNDVSHIRIAPLKH